MRWMNIDKGMWLEYPSSIEHIVEQNESFDSCVIKICYTGKNRNKSSISKQAIEDALPSIYNCPIVCNYNIYEDTIGGHDIEIVSTNNGMRLINLTDAIGVIPYNCNYYWETSVDNGVEHDYLCVEAILWKRSAAYNKIKRDGIVSQSMEITVKSGHTIDGFYEIDKFIFTAFCLLGDDVEPCFESASLEVFSLQQYKQTLDTMMADFKKYFSTVTTSQEDDINSQNITQNLSKGGNITLDKTELLSEYGLSEEALDFDINDFTIDELREKFEALKKTKQNNDDEDDNKPIDDTGEDDSNKDTTEDDDKGTQNDTDEEFSLTGEQFLEQLYEALSAVKCSNQDWGEMCKYLYVDFDYALSEVYCYDCEDWKLYGFTYSMDGDNIHIDFESKKRKKISIVDFDEGSADANYKYAFALLGQIISASKDAEFSTFKAKSEEKYSQAAQTIHNLQMELTELKQYKQDKLHDERKTAENDLFARFAELNGIEAFESLRADCASMSIEDIESKCYELKGRYAKVEFSTNRQKSPRIPVERNPIEDEPYGGLFVKYLPKKN